MSIGSLYDNEKYINERKKQLCDLMDDLTDSIKTIEFICESLGPRVGCFDPDLIFAEPIDAIEDEIKDCVAELQVLNKRSRGVQVAVMDLEFLFKLRGRAADLHTEAHTRVPESVEIAIQNLQDVITQEIGKIAGGHHDAA